MALAGPDRTAFRLITAAAVAIAVLGLVGARRALCALPTPPDPISHLSRYLHSITPG